MSIDDIDAKKIKEHIATEDYQNRLVMVVEHTKKCPYCRNIAKALETLETTLFKHMEESEEALR